MKGAGHAAARAVKWEGKVEEMIGRGRRMSGREAAIKAAVGYGVAINIAKGSLFMVI